MWNPTYFYKETQTQDQTHTGHDVVQGQDSETDLFPQSST